MSIHIDMSADEVRPGPLGRSLPVEPEPRRLPRALIADDDPDSAECLAMLIERDGFEVRVAHDGLAALAMAAAFEPEMALIDMVMPECTGLELAALIRAAPWGARMVLIATSGRGSDTDKRAARAAGFDAYLTKPLDYDVLRSLLQRPLSAGTSARS
jgi:CheY-like chemotaxis protein